MSSIRTKPSPRGRWQNMTIAIVILFLLLSALPNVYQEKAVIRLTALSSSAPLVTSKSLKGLLQQHQLTVDEISTNASVISMTLAERSQQGIAEQLLNKAYGKNYLITSSVESQEPKWLQSLGAEPIKLGLDLSGGVLFVLDVDIEQALAERLNQIGLDIQLLAIKQQLRGVTLDQTSEQGITLNLPSYNPAKTNSFITQLKQSFPELQQAKLAGNKMRLFYGKEELTQFRQETMQQTLKIMRGRIEQLGITEATVQRQGKDRIRIELPGVHDAKEAERIIGATASLEFYQLSNDGSRMAKRISSENGQSYQVNPRVIFSGSHIKDARSGVDQLGLPLVNLSLDDIGGKKMSQFSKHHIGQPMVTVFTEYYQNAKGQAVKRSKVINVATIQQHLASAFSITNMSSQQAAQELALLLRAGSLNAPVTIVQQQNISATLGADNIKYGVMALAAGVIFTLAFMAVWYRTLGLVANFALALNLVCLLGLMSLLPGVVLTLPGIAGLVLTVGMAVDTNVLIFERIKEEIRRGRKLPSAIELGYKQAFSTILDANITTLLTGIILYAIGYGAVKGFAVILCLGILTSIFTGVFVSKALSRLLLKVPSNILVGAKS